MREIKFKAKRVDNGEWGYGDILQDYEQKQVKIVMWVSKLVEPDVSAYELSIEEHEVNPDTICQFTGQKFCKDWEKQWEEVFEVYEDDIVEVWCYDSKILCQVKYVDFRFVAIPINDLDDIWEEEIELKDTKPVNFRLHGNLHTKEQ